MTRRADAARFSAVSYLLLVAWGGCTAAVSGCDGRPLSASSDSGSVVFPVPTPPVAVSATATGVVVAPVPSSTALICPGATMVQYYAVDADGDGWGTAVLTPSCTSTPPPGFVAPGGTLDCDDQNSNRTAAAFCPDADGDGLGDATRRGGLVCVGNEPSGWVVDCSDCNDADKTLQSLAYVDEDADGFGADDTATCGAKDAANQPGSSATAGDCDDTRAEIFPGSIAERPFDETNSDCDNLGFDFATHKESTSDEQLDTWVASIPVTSDCENGVDLYILDLVLASDSWCFDCANELVFANRGGRTANVAYRRRLNGALVEQTPLGELKSGAWLRVSDVHGNQRGTHEFSISDANQGAECHPEDNSVSLKASVGDPPL
jgi:hypothetical protein